MNLHEVVELQSQYDIVPVIVWVDRYLYILCNVLSSLRAAGFDELWRVINEVEEVYGKKWLGHTRTANSHQW